MIIGVAINVILSLGFYKIKVAAMETTPLYQLLLDLCIAYLPTYSPVHPWALSNFSFNWNIQILWSLLSWSLYLFKFIGTTFFWPLESHFVFALTLWFTIWNLHLVINIELVQDDPKVPGDGGEIPKSQRRGWQFGSRLRNLLSTWQNTCQVVNSLLCFGSGMSVFCLKKTNIINVELVVFPAAKSPFYLTKYMSGGQLPLVLWLWHVGLLSQKNKHNQRRIGCVCPRQMCLCACWIVSLVKLYLIHEHVPKIVILQHVWLYAHVVSISVHGDEFSRNGSWRAFHITRWDHFTIIYDGENRMHSSSLWYHW